jgi:hypothetical protein
LTDARVGISDTVYATLVGNSQFVLPTDVLVASAAGSFFRTKYQYQRLIRSQLIWDHMDHRSVLEVYCDDLGYRDFRKLL